MILGSYLSLRGQMPVHELTDVADRMIPLASQTDDIFFKYCYRQFKCSRRIAYNYKMYLRVIVCARTHAPIYINLYMQSP